MHHLNGRLLRSQMQPFSHKDQDEKREKGLGKFVRERIILAPVVYLDWGVER